MTIDEIIAALDGAGDAEFENVLRAQFDSLRREMPTALASALREAGSTPDAMFEILAEGHTSAAYMGRRLAGSDFPFGDYDTEFGKLVAESQREYLENFFADVQSGRYTGDDGALDESAISNRANYYQERLRGTANEAWCGSLDAEELIDWILDDGADSCTVCPDLAENSPYSPGDMPTWPGANETPCLFNCACGARTQSGKFGF
jgi:hypothetical protein